MDMGMHMDMGMYMRTGIEGAHARVHVHGHGHGHAHGHGHVSHVSSEWTPHGSELSQSR